MKVITKLDLWFASLTTYTFYTFTLMSSLYIWTLYKQIFYFHFTIYFYDENNDDDNGKFKFIRPLITDETNVIYYSTNKCHHEIEHLYYKVQALHCFI